MWKIVAKELVNEGIFSLGNRTIGEPGKITYPSTYRVIVLGTGPGPESTIHHAVWQLVLAGKSHNLHR
jgi:hypothetical protein